MKIDDIQKIAHNHNLQEIRTIKDKYSSNLKLLKQMIDSKIIEETKKGNDNICLFDSDLKPMMNDCNISTDEINSISFNNWTNVIAYFYKKAGFDADGYSNSLHIYWFSNNFNALNNDIASIFNNQSKKTLNIKNDNNEDLPNLDDDDEDLPDLDDNDEDLDNDNEDSIDTSDNGANWLDKNYVTDFTNDELTTSKVDNIYHKFEQYFGKSNLYNQIFDVEYTIRLQVYETKQFIYCFDWTILYPDAKKNDEDDIFKILNESLEFTIVDKKAIAENRHMEIPFDNIDGDDINRGINFVSIRVNKYDMIYMIPIIQGWAQGKKRLKFYNKVKEIKDFKSFYKLYCKYHMQSVLWINAIAPNALVLNTNHKYPLLSMSGETDIVYPKGPYFHDFNWHWYSDIKQSEKSFYQYVWIKMVDFYYFKQDYYRYKHIFVPKHKIYALFNSPYKVYDTYAHYSMSYLTLISKANILFKQASNKDMSKGWSTQRMPSSIIYPDSSLNDIY